MTKFLWILVFSITAIGLLQAQEYSLQSLYRMVPNLVNPATTGLNGDMRLQLLYKKQLTGFEKSPNMRLLSFQMGLPDERIGLGINLSQDQNGPLLYSRLSGTFSYQIEFGRSTYKKMDNILSFGISPSFSMFQVKKADLEPLEQEPLLDDFIESSIQMNGDFGAYLFMDGFELGFSLYNLELYKTKPTVGINAPFNPILYLNVGYVSEIGEYFDIYPSVLLSAGLVNDESNNSDKVSIDINMTTNIHMSDVTKLMMGAGYRHAFQYNSPIAETAVVVGGLTYDMFMVGYQYNIPFGAGLGVLNGEHSLTIGFVMDSEFKKRRRYRSNNWFR